MNLYFGDVIVVLNVLYIDCVKLKIYMKKVEIVKFVIFWVSYEIIGYCVGIY